MTEFTEKEQRLKASQARITDAFINKNKRIAELEGIASCLLNSYITSFSGAGKDALATKTEALIPNWRALADEYDPTK